MKKTIVCLSVVAGVFLPSMKGNAFPFTSYQLPFHITKPGSKITQFTYKIQKQRIELNWTVEMNRDSYLFEIEMSKDGKNYTTAALVFCSDKPDTEQYSFHATAKSSTNYYRIKIQHKDNSITYSEVITIKADN